MSKTINISLADEAYEALQRLASERWLKPSQMVAQLVRDAVAASSAPGAPGSSKVGLQPGSIRARKAEQAARQKAWDDFHKSELGHLLEYAERKRGGGRLDLANNRSYQMPPLFVGGRGRPRLECMKSLAETIQRIGVEAWIAESDAWRIWNVDTQAFEQIEPIWVPIHTTRPQPEAAADA